MFSNAKNSFFFFLGGGGARLVVGGPAADPRLLVRLCHLHEYQPVSFFLFFFLSPYARCFSSRPKLSRSAAARDLIAI